MNDKNNVFILSNGVTIPKIGFGTARIKGEECYIAVLNALKCGYRHIDTALMYENEKEVGRAIRDSKIPREEIFVTSKIYSPSRSYILALSAVKESLLNLGLSYIDLMLIHEPYDEDVEMYKALEECYDKKLLRAIGISNYNEDEYLEFIKKVDIIPHVNQVECHPYYLRENLKKTLNEHNTLMESWATLTGGKKDIFNEQILVDIAKKYNKTVAQVVLNYFIYSGISVIPKSVSSERMKANLDSLNFILSEEDILKIESLNNSTSLFGWY